MKNDRLFQVVYILLEKGMVTAPELAQTLEVSTRTIYRDVEALSLAGIPVFASAGKGGGISLMPGYSFDRALLSDAEQNEILFAIQSLRATQQPVGTLLSKLGGMFQKPPVDWIEVDFSRWGMGKMDHERFDRIKTAILEKHVLNIEYCGANGTLSQRDIKPYKLIFKDKNWYLQAFCMKAEDYRLFKVSRIRTLAETGGRFTETFEAVQPLEQLQPPPMFVESIVLTFSPQVAFRVYDEFEQSTITKGEDGRLTVETSMPVDAWVLGYLMGFGCGVEIVSPKTLQSMVAQMAKKIYLHHKT